MDINYYKLYQGDCLEVLDSFENNSVDLIITDPPYGLGFEYPSYADTEENLIELIKNFVPKAKRVSERVYILSGITPMYHYPKPDWIISCSWNTTGSYGLYGYTQWMPILCYGKDLEGIGKINGVLKSDSITISGGSGVGFMRNKKDKKHVCPKPLNLMEKVVKRLSNEREVILDPFIGSGTTMEACQNLQRQCIGIDIDPYYCDLVKERCFHKTFLDRKAEYIFEVYNS